MTGPIDTARRWTGLTAGVAGVFALFHALASVLGSDRGQAGISVCAIVVAATLAIEWAGFRASAGVAGRALGLGQPSIVGLLAAAGACAALLATVPLYGRATGTSMAVMPGALSLLPGLFAQGGVAEEVLFRSYLFGHLRVGRPFWRAAWLSMLPFSLVHVPLFFTMPWPVALAALVLSVIVSFPLAHLFELGGRTVWPPALLHFVVQGTVKVVAFPEDAAVAFPLAWMAASAVIPWAVFLVPRRT
ncbi:MAG: lysostaphin resistance A-like protein [Vicinamibacterales bacterium]